MRNPKCRMILAHFPGKQNWQNRRTQSAPRSGRIIERRAPSQVPRGAVDIDDFDLPAAVAGEAVLLKCMRARRSSVRGIPGSAAVLCRRTNPARQQQARQARLDRVRRICAQQIAGRSINRGCSCRARCFRCALSLGPTPRRRGRAGATMLALVSPGPSWSTAEAVSRCGQSDAKPSPQPSSRAQCRLHRTAVDRTSHVNDGTARRAPGPSINSPVRWRQVVEPALYTVEGRQAGDLRQKCGSALIRKAKLPVAIVWKVVPFLQGSG